MMNNLFSIFDPYSPMINIQLNWLNIFLIFFFIPYSYWLIPNSFQMMWIKFMTLLNNEINIILKKKIFKGINLFFCSLFFFLMFNNLLGLFPYIFTASSHMMFNISFSLPIWMTLMFFGWMNLTQNMFAHLIPLNTPLALIPFMIIIETISNVIRPLTLAIRLTANMIAGHILIFLLMNNNTSLFIFSIISIIEILLMILELSVSIIQAYVFTMLSMLYLSEIN